MITNFIRKWFYKWSAQSASDFQLEHHLWFTNSPAEFMASLREARKRYGAVDNGIVWLNDKTPRSRLYNFSYSFNQARI